MKAKWLLLIAGVISTSVFVQSAWAEVFSHRIRGLEITTKQQQAQIAQLKKDMEKLKKAETEDDLASKFDQAGKKQLPNHKQPTVPYSFP